MSLTVCIPSRAEPSPETQMALANNLGSTAHEIVAVVGQPVVDARNELARRALERGAEFTLWLDDDAFFEPGTVERLLAAIRAQPSIDMLAAFACDRKPFCSPNAFRLHGDRYVALVERSTQAPVALPAWAPRYSIGEIVPIDACAFHAVLMRTALLERMGAAPFALAREDAYGEDLQFCRRARAAGAHLALESGASVAHVDAESGLAFLPYKPPGRIVGNRFTVVPDTRSAAEIAAPWRERDIRAGRGYGAELDAIFRSAYHRTQGKPHSL